MECSRSQIAKKPPLSLEASLLDKTCLNLFQPNDPRISAGRFTYGDPKITLWSPADEVRIGSFCSIAGDVSILAGGEHKSDWVSTFPFNIGFNLPAAHQDGIPATKGAIIIGNDVWIGQGAMILSGVCIGDGAIIGAGALIARDVEPYEIVVGNPQRHLKYRFEASVIEKLLKIKWWNWPIERILENAALLSSQNINQFLEHSDAI